MRIAKMMVVLLFILSIACLLSGCWISIWGPDELVIDDRDHHDHHHHRDYDRERSGPPPVYRDRR